MRWLAERGTDARPGAATRASARRALTAAVQRGLLDRFLKSQVAEHAYLPMAGFETRMRMPIELERVRVPLRARVAAAQPDRARANERTLDREEREGVIDFDHA